MVHKKRRSFITIILLVFALVLTSAILSVGSRTGLNAGAYNSSSAVPASIGSLTLSGYESRTDGQIFDPQVLAKLYGAITGKATDTYKNAYTTVNSTTSSVVGKATVAAKSTNNQSKSMNFSQIKAANKANGSIPVTVEFGGYTWNVVYFTTNTLANASNGGKAGDLIVTLWMSEVDSNVGEVSWTGFTTQSATLTGAYAENEYAMSKIRVETLNAGNIDNTVATQYATGINAANLATVSTATRLANDYAKFTLSNTALNGTAKANQSLVDFLATPSQAVYQRAENFVWSFSYDGSPYLLLNDAWGNGTNGTTGPDISLEHPNTSASTTTKGWYNGTKGNMNYVIDNENYYKWKDDYLWLPSLTETGFYYSGGHGASLWGIPTAAGSGDNILLSASDIWTRSGDEDNARNAKSLGLTGTYHAPSNAESHSVRPALHINLTKAQANVELELPKAMTKTYDGTPQGPNSTTESWFTTDFSSVVDVTYYKGTTPISQPTEAGTYEVAFTIKSDCKKAWADGDVSSNTRRVTMIINPKKVDFPSWVGGVNEGTYNGTSLGFYLSYDTSLISLTPPSGVTITGNSVAVTNAGEYEITAGLKNTTNYTWADDAPSDHKLHLTVNPATIGVELTGNSGEHDLVSSKSASLSGILKIDYNNNKDVISGDRVEVRIVADLGVTGVSPEVIATIVLDDTSRSVPVSFDLSRLFEGYTYHLKVQVDDKKLDGANYTTEQPLDTTLKLEVGVRSVLTWQLTADGIYVFGEYVDANVKQLSVAFGGTPIVYDGRSYEFKPLLPTGYSLDKGFGIDGVKVLPQTTTNGAPGVNADRYTTQIQMKKDSDPTDVDVYEITWEIKKAKFDLSNVKWVGNGEVPYTGNTVTEELDSTTVPAGLVPSYMGVNTGSKVGDHGTVTVSFADLTGDYAINYEKPIETDTDSYIGTFEWSKSWSVVKAKIPVVWQNSVGEDKNRVPFTYPTIKGNYDDVLDYLFFETDEDGNIKDIDHPITIRDIEIDENNRKFYKVKPVFKNDSIAKNYELDDVYSTYFQLGEASEAVELGLEEDKLQYTGKPQDVVIKILTSTIGVGSLDIVYYDRNGVTPLSGAPTNQGEYRVEISIKAGVSGYYLTGDNVANGVAVIDFEITKRIVDNSTWVTTHNPPSLKLTYAEIQGVTYDYADMDGNTLTFAQLRAGNSYKVRARIKDQTNYEFLHDFDGDVYTTDWKVFTVSENEQLFDPTDPSNPYYPEDPDAPINPDDPNNPGNNGGNNGGNSVSDFFNKLLYEDHFPLWQIIVMAVSALLAIIFIVKAAQYGSRAKKANADAKKLNAKTYASLLPVFSTEVVAGLANKTWSIMAFAFAGFAVAMLIVALIMRHVWKKAELAREAAIEDNEQRKAEAQEAKQLAREEAQEARQRELQETLILASQGGGGQGSDNSALIEQMRMEMEAREARYREELARRDEEQAKRDETMKLMLANLMGRQSGDDNFAYATMDDTDMLVQRVIAGLLPAMQEFMPEATAYLNAPSNEDNEELKALVEEQKALVEEQRAIVEEQNEEIRNISVQMIEMQAQLEAMSQDRVDGVIIEGSDEKIAEMADTMQQQLEKIEELQTQIAEMSQNNNETDSSEEMQAMADTMQQQLEKIEELQAQIAEMSQNNNETDNSEEMQAMADAMREQLAKIEELQAQLDAMNQERVDGVLLPDESEEMKAILARMDELQAQLSTPQQESEAAADNSDEIKALTEQIAAMREQLAERPKTITNTVYIERETDEEDTDDEEEWDSILDEEDDFIEATVVDADGTVRKTTPNFRMRLKESSDKNREWYAAIKNLFCSQKGITYRVYKRVEKIRYQGQVIAVIGIAKRSIKLWLALKPYEYDARRYHHKDVSDKPRFVDVPLYVRVGSDRALMRAQELILALFQEQAMEARKRYNDRSIQELIFTLKHNRLLTNKQNKQLLCEVMHVHDCDVLDNETAEKCIEAKNVDVIDDSVIETVKLDDIDANFQDGNRVTLDKLRKAGLVSEACTGYTVVAGQRLTKPLIIVANDFTLEAVKMIALTGGRVIRLTQV